jgi:hypothetical protein
VKVKDKHPRGRLRLRCDIRLGEMSYRRKEEQCEKLRGRSYGKRDILVVDPHKVETGNMQFG